MAKLKICFLVFLWLFLLEGRLLASETNRNLPYYLSPWETAVKEINNDELKKWKVINRMFMATEKCSFTEVQTIINGSETASTIIEGKETKVIFDNYVREDNVIVYYSSCGKKELTLEEFNLVKKDIIELYQEAVDDAWFKYQELTPEILKRAAEKSGMTSEEFQKRLAEKVGNTGISYAEVAQINKISKSDFVLKEFHFGTIQRFILGLTLLNTGRVMYSEQARLYDYINGKPLVLVHELIHANLQLQKIPLAWYFDAELAASFPEMMDDKSDLDTFISHGYLPDIRWAAKVFFGFDSEKFKKEILKFQLIKSQLEINEAVFWKYENLIKRMKNELKQEIFLNILPEFYSDPLFWATVNERFNDDNAYFKIIMSMHYDPTLLGGHENTMKWLGQNSEKIKEMAEDAWRQTAEALKAENEEKEKETKFLKKMANIAKFLGISDEQIKFLAKKYEGLSPAEIKNKILDLLEKTFGWKNGGER